jgi:hypothetical protein
MPDTEDIDVTPEQLAALLINDDGAPVETPKVEETKVEPAKAEEKPVEPVVDPKEVEREARQAKRIEVARRAELQAAQERRRAQAEAQEAKTLREKMENLKKDPLGTLKEIGLDPTEFLERVVSDGKPTQESLIKELQAQLQQINDERAQERLEIQRAQVQSTVYKAMDEFVDLVAANSAKYSHLVDEYTPEEIARQALAYGKQYGRAYVEATGEDLTDDVIASKLEELAAARSATRRSWSEKVKGKQTSQVPSESVKVGDGPQVNTKPEAPRTLSNDMASERASAPKTWSQEDADAQSLLILQKAFSSAD